MKQLIFVPVMVILVASQARSGAPESCIKNPVFRKQVEIKNKLEQLLKLYPKKKDLLLDVFDRKSGERAELLFRLVETYIQISQSCPSIAKEAQTKAMALYREILKQFPNYSRKEEMQFCLATSLWDMGQKTKALKIFQQLGKSGGKFAADALLTFGDYYFEQADMEKARMAYQKVLSFPDSKLTTYARYKLAWVSFNLQEWRRSANLFRQVIESNKDKDPTLCKAAIKDYVMVYSKFGKASMAPRTFQAVAPGHKRKMLVRLASIFLDDGKTRDSITVHRFLLDTAKSKLDAGIQQLGLLRCMVQLGNREKIIEETENLCSILERLPTEGDQRLSELRKEARKLIGGLAKTWKSESIKAFPEDQRFSKKMNSLFQGAFPQ